ncbi:LAETG motif-containing sortase-dependent surface protein [Streptomyces sp. NPDC017529]|uniref:LAETG motif-containing sortase-dependent surface protein n=1 Tax=Streptomyces sp. NPDC017529 TaxID=3365000 RepID=UPI003789EC00
MKLRRALAAVTATAALAPAALLAAPAAYAAEPPGGAPAATPTATPTPGASQTATSPAPGQSSPAPQNGESSGTATPGPTASSAAPGAGRQAGKAEPTPTLPQTPSESPTCEDFSSERAVKAQLLGLPTKIVAGSGWVGFTFRATNVSGKHIRSVDAFAQVYALDNKTTDDISGHLAFEWFDARAGVWKRVPGAEEGDGYFAQIAGADGLRPGEYADAKLRIKADAKTPAGYGGAVSVGWYLNADLECGYSDATDYSFDILPAGSSKPGHVPDAQGKPGKRPNRPSPQGGSKQQAQLPVTGKLAETGASSALPAVALSGAAAVALGAGAVFVVRRRKGAGAS